MSSLLDPLEFSQIMVRWRPIAVAGQMHHHPVRRPSPAMRSTKARRANGPAPPQPDVLSDGESKRYLSLIYEQNAVIATDFKEAHRLLASAKLLDEQQLEENREPGRAREELAQGYSDLGTVCLRENNIQCAQAAFDKSLAMRTALYAADPADAKMRRYLAMSYCNAGRAQLRSSAHSRAEVSLRGVALLKTLLDSDPGNIKLLRESALAYQDLAANSLLSAHKHAKTPQAECEKAKHNIDLCRTFWGLAGHISPPSASRYQSRKPAQYRIV